MSSPSIAASHADADVLAPPGRARTRQNWADQAFGLIVLAMATLIVVFAILLVIAMIQEGDAALAQFGLNFITGSTWNPVTHEFGVLPAIFGTIATAAIAVLLA